VGEQTLLRLNEQSGVDISIAAAIERFTLQAPLPADSAASAAAGG
jgi:hypothetical protein